MQEACRHALGEALDEFGYAAVSAAGTVIVAGSVAQRPGNGGHTWVFLQYLLGFRRLGWDVLLLDRLEPEMCVDAQGRPVRPSDSVNLAYLDRVLRALRARRPLGLLLRRRATALGRRATRCWTRSRRSALLLNVKGFLDDPEVLAAAPLRAFLDIDPGFAQMWRDARPPRPVRGPRRAT